MEIYFIILLVFIAVCLIFLISMGIFIFSRLCETLDNVNMFLERKIKHVNREIEYIEWEMWQTRLDEENRANDINEE